VGRPIVVPMIREKRARLNGLASSAVARADVRLL